MAPRRLARTVQDMTFSTIAHAWRTEPVRVVTATIALLVAFGLVAFTDVQAQAVIALVAVLAGGGEVARSQVSPAQRDLDTDASE